MAVLNILQRDYLVSTPPTYTILTAHHSLGFKVIQIHLIFSPVPTHCATDSQLPIFIYGQFFKFLNLHWEMVDGVNVFKTAPHIDMFLLTQHMQANGQHMGDIV